MVWIKTSISYKCNTPLFIIILVGICVVRHFPFSVFYGPLGVTSGSLGSAQTPFWQPLSHWDKSHAPHIILTRLFRFKTRPDGDKHKHHTQTSQRSLWKLDSIREQQGRMGPSVPQVPKQHMTRRLKAEKVTQPYIIQWMSFTRDWLS